GFQSPDIVGNIRLDQTWGSAQVMAAAHEVNPVYFCGTAAVGTFGPEGCGHAGDKWGFVVGAGLRLNAPFIAQGDFFQTQVNYTQGALRYMFQNNNENYFLQRGRNAAFGITSDAVVSSFGPGNPNTFTTGVELTTGWNVNASYEHYWTPQFHESFYGGIGEVRYDTTANNNLCAVEGFNVGSVTTPIAAPGCNNNWSTWWAGSRLQYDITKTFYIGVDFLYTRIESASTPFNILPLAVIPAGTALGCPTVVGPASATCKVVSDENNLQVRFRVHKDFLP